MINVTCRIDGGDLTLDIKGHADSHICASVSAVAQTAILGLKALAKTHPEHITIDDQSPQRRKRPPP